MLKYKKMSKKSVRLLQVHLYNIYSDKFTRKCANYINVLYIHDDQDQLIKKIYLSREYIFINKYFINHVSCVGTIILLL